MYNSMIKKYGSEKGKSVFYAYMNEHHYDETKPRSSSKEIKLSPEKISKISVKEELYTKGNIATTHIDSVGDKIMPETLYKWADVINSTNNGEFTANPVSIHHNRDDKDLAGLGKAATVTKLPDGEYGLWVETHHNKFHPDFDKTKYELDNDFLTHYSIEYNTHDGATTHKLVNSGKEIRIIEPNTELLGYGLASPRTVVNSEAKIEDITYKELINFSEAILPDNLKQTNEVIPMEPTKTETIPEIKETSKEVPAVKEISIKEITAQVKEKLFAEIKEELKAATPDKSPLIETKEKIENKEVEIKEVKEFKESVYGAKKASVSQQWMNAHKLVNKIYAEGKELRVGNMPGPNARSTPFEVKEGKIELKDLTTDDNPAYSTNSYYTSATSYTQTPTEFNDIYGPVIINQLSEAVVAWNKIPSEDQSGYSTATFRTKDAANSTVTGTNSFQSHGSTPTWDGNTGRTKYQIPFVTSYAEIRVEDEEIELSNSPGGIGNIYEREVQDATESWISAMNKYFLTGTTAVSESIPYGLQKTLISTGNLYGRDVASFTKMAVGGYDDMSAGPITLKKMRDMVDTVVMNGADEGSLFFIGKHTQVTKVKTLIQKSQVIVDKSARIGFEGLPMLDTTPVFADKDCDSDDLFLLEQKSWKKMIKKAPTYVEFAKTSLHRKGIIWMMFNIGCTNPNHNYWVYNLQTT